MAYMLRISAIAVLILGFLVSSVPAFAAVRPNTPVVQGPNGTIAVEPVSTTQQIVIGSSSTNIMGVYSIIFAVSALNADAYISGNASTLSEAGIAYGIVGSSFSGNRIASIDTESEQGNGFFIVRKGETENFTLRITLDPDATGAYAVGLEKINYASSPTGAPVSFVIPSNANGFRTGTLFIAGGLPPPPSTLPSCKLTQQRAPGMNPHAVKVSWETTYATRVEWVPSIGQAVFGQNAWSALPAQGSITGTIPEGSDLALIMRVTNSAGSSNCSTRFVPVPPQVLPSR